MSTDTRAGLRRRSPRSRGRSPAAGAPLDPILGDLAAAAAQGTERAQLAAIWLPEPRRARRSRVWATSGAHAAELEGVRADSLEQAAELVRGHLDGDAECLSVPLGTGGEGGVLELARRGTGFEPDATQVAVLAADLAGLALRLGADDPAASNASALDVAGEALAAVTDDTDTPARRPARRRGGESRGRTDLAPAPG